MKIVEGYKSVHEFFEGGSWLRQVYVRPGKLRLQCYRDSFTLTELENAFKAGSYCPQYSVMAEFNDMQALLHRNHYDMAAVAAELRDVLTPHGEGKSVPLKDGGTGSWRARPSNRSFSPFDLARIKPLKAPLTGKWTLAHARRAIANGQYEKLRCDGHYTDDYAGDAASDFRRGEIQMPLEFLRKLVEDPSGWWTSLDTESNRVSVCCHTFDSNSFMLKLDKVEPLKP